jgi:hypothetical protein
MLESVMAPDDVIGLDEVMLKSMSIKCDVNNTTGNCVCSKDDVFPILCKFGT